MHIPRLPSDKEGHLIMGLVFFCIFGLISPIAGVIAAVIIGAAKEIYDQTTGKGTPDVWDFVATFSGGLVGYFCTYL